MKYTTIIIMISSYLASFGYALGQDGRSRGDDSAESRLMETGRCDHCNLEGVDLSDRELTVSTLQGISFRNANLRGLVIHVDSIVGSDFSGADMSGTRILARLMSHNVFHRTNMTGAQVTATELFSNNSIHRSSLQRAIFSSGKCDHSRFERSSMVETFLKFDGMMHACHIINCNAQDLQIRARMIDQQIVGTRMRYSTMVLLPSHRQVQDLWIHSSDLSGGNISIQGDASIRYEGQTRLSGTWINGRRCLKESVDICL